MRYGPGPVFEAECLTASRRVSFYAARVVLVLGLLAGLAVAWAVSAPSASGRLSVAELASVGHRFYVALMGIELGLVLAIAPASTAGAICDDRAKGGLALLMTTDLSDSEIVLGRLASRLLAVLGVIASGLPVLALSILLGGVDPLEVIGGTLVVTGVASLSVGVALAFSLWAGQSQEALSATYAVWAAWLLAVLMVWNWRGFWTPWWVCNVNPIWLLFSNWPIVDRLPMEGLFFAGSLAATAALAGLSTWKLRAVTLHRRKPSLSSRETVRRPPPAWLRWIGQVSPRLDDDPALWREWHRKRPSSFTRVLWWVYAVPCVAFSAWGVYDPWNAPMVNGVQVSIGLLLACVGSATSLAEERVQGGLDVVLATPLDSRRIVAAKWWGAFRVIPRLAVLPGLLVFVAGLMRHKPWGEVVSFSALVVALVLLYGAVLTGLGLIIAIGQARPGRAVTWTVGCYLMVTVAYPFAVLFAVGLGPAESLPTWPSPFMGVLMATDAAMQNYNGSKGDKDPSLALGFLGLMALTALALFRVARGSFDRGMGRVADRPTGAVASR